MFTKGQHYVVNDDMAVLCNCALLSPHADRHARDMSFTVCPSVCLSARLFVSDISGHRLTQVDDIWQYGSMDDPRGVKGRRQNL